MLGIAIGSRSVYVDLSAEKFLVAEKEDRKIAVEIKSFLSPYILDRDALERSEPQRIFYLAIRDEVYLDFF
jgi:XisH protein